MCFMRWLLVVVLGAGLEGTEYQWTSQWLRSHPRQEIVVPQCRRYVRMLCDCPTLKLKHYAIRFSPGAPEECFDEKRFLVKDWEGRSDCFPETKTECLGQRPTGEVEEDSDDNNVRIIVSMAILLGCALLISGTCLFGWYKSGQLQDEEYLEREKVEEKKLSV